MMSTKKESTGHLVGIGNFVQNTSVEIVINSNGIKGGRDQFLAFVIGLGESIVVVHPMFPIGQFFGGQVVEFVLRRGDLLHVESSKLHILVINESNGFIGKMQLNVSFFGDTLKEGRFANIGDHGMMGGDGLSTDRLQIGGRLISGKGGSSMMRTSAVVTRHKGSRQGSTASRIWLFAIATAGSRRSAGGTSRREIARGTRTTMFGASSGGIGTGTTMGRRFSNPLFFVLGRRRRSRIQILGALFRRRRRRLRRRGERWIGVLLTDDRIKTLFNVINRQCTQTTVAGGCSCHVNMTARWGQARIAALLRRRRLIAITSNATERSVISLKGGHAVVAGSQHIGILIDSSCCCSCCTRCRDDSLWIKGCATITSRGGL